VAEGFIENGECGGPVYPRNTEFCQECRHQLYPTEEWMAWRGLDRDDKYKKAIRTIIGYQYQIIDALSPASPEEREKLADAYELGLDYAIESLGRSLSGTPDRLRNARLHLMLCKTGRFRKKEAEHV